MKDSQDIDGLLSELDKVEKRIHKKRERKVDQEIRAWCVDQGYDYVKNTPVGCAGFPDRLIIVPDWGVLYLEVKRPGETPTKLQLDWLAKLRAANMHATWSDSSDKAITWIQDTVEWSR